MTQIDPLTVSRTPSEAPKIAVLPSDLINQIAAGEVIERPASVVKELVENAIDAGARSIEVRLVNGGKKLIEVNDDGCGMSEMDARLAVQRHATSKIRRFEDLSSIATLGFRGEALPSIASVSRFTLLTSDGNSGDATEIELDPLVNRTSVRPAARDRGTTIRVAELFENVPARKKFLKSADAEFRSIVTILSSYALPAPFRSFRLWHNDRLIVDLPSALTVRDRVLQVIGDDAAPHLAELDIQIELSRASGFVTRGLRYGSRRNQFFFVNGRLVRDRVLTHAANRAAEAFDFDGHPAVIVFLDIDPNSVDVNVHPAKTEVRFRDSGQMHVLVETAVKRALGGAEEGGGLLTASAPNEPQLPMVADSPLPVAAMQQPLMPVLNSAPAQGDAAYRFSPLFQSRPVVQPPPPPDPQLGDLAGRVIGQYRSSYIAIDSPEGLRLVDQHVAHERVLYDRIAATAGDAHAVQRLLEPVVYEAGAAEAGVLTSHIEELRSLGFDIELFSRNSFAISATPTILGRESVERFLQKLIDSSADERTPHVAHLRHRVIASLACQAAIKVHRTLGGVEMSHLVADLLASSNPYACPHGRPIIVDIRHLDIEKHFHRK